MEDMKKRQENLVLLAKDVLDHAEEALVRTRTIEDHLGACDFPHNRAGLASFVEASASLVCGIRDLAFVLKQLADFTVEMRADGDLDADRVAERVLAELAGVAV